MSRFFVYGLFDSGDPEACRYVGAASTPRRPLSHVREAVRCPSRRTHKLNWIRRILAEGRTVVWRSLEDCADWQETLLSERRIIRAMRESGARLTNANDGGQGNFNPTPEVRARISRLMSVVQARPEVNARRSASLKAAWARPGAKARRGAIARISHGSPEVRAAASEREKARCADPGWRARKSAQAKADWAKPEAEERRAAMRLSMNAPEVKAARLVAQRAAWSDPTARKRRLAAMAAGRYGAAGAR